MKTKKLAFRHLNTTWMRININSTHCGAEQVRSALDNAAVANLPTGGDVYRLCDQRNARLRLRCNWMRLWEAKGERLRRSGHRGRINSSGFCVRATDN